MKLKNASLWAGFFLLSSTMVLAEDWKGKPDPAQMSFGAITGMGIIDNSVGFSLLGTISRKIVQPGFISDLNNAVSIEGEVGPVFRSETTAWAYAADLRWDFTKDLGWTFFALGGVGGNIRSVNDNTIYEFFPRFGIGAFWKISPQVALRMQVTHDVLGVGVNFPF